MKYFIIVVLLGCTFCVTQVQGQSKKEKKKSDSESYQQAPSSRDPGSSTTAARKSVKKSGGSNFNSQAMEDYAKLKKENAKKYRKIEKMKDDPQYADPSYFGHKKRPKKRKVGKRKYCKECGIVH
ncbi:MAG: hypothetical protein ACR2MX_14555 [Cyclobacteriaceae bacterium]